MKKVYSAQDVRLVGQLKGALESKGVECIVKNADLRGGFAVRGDKPPSPELWIKDDTQLLLANRLLNTILLTELNQTEPWRCVNCGEELESQFAECRSCGAANQYTLLIDESEDDEEEE